VEKESKSELADLGSPGKWSLNVKLTWWWCSW